MGRCLGGLDFCVVDGPSVAEAFHGNSGQLRSWGSSAHLTTLVGLRNWCCEDRQHLGTSLIVYCKAAASFFRRFSSRMVVPSACRLTDHIRAWLLPGTNAVDGLCAHPSLL